MNEDLYIPLIQQHLNQSISPEDEKILTEWIDSSVDNKQFYENIKSAWENSSDYGSNITVDLEQEWNRLDHKIKNSSRYNIKLWVAAASLFLVTSIFFLLPKKETIDIIATMDNQKITLEDGSTITLEKESSISYKSSYSKNRKIKLTGAAHLDVVHNPSAPFIVQGPDISVTVLGTNFLFIDKQADDIAEVQLIEGKVKVVAKGFQEAATLSTGQRYTYKQGQPVVTDQLNLKSQEWYKVDLDFKNQPLSHVISQLADYHGTNITLNRSIENCKFNGNLGDIPLSMSLKNIAEIYSCRLIESKGQFILSEGQCE